MIEDWKNCSKQIGDLFVTTQSKYDPAILCLIISCDVVIHSFNTKIYEEFVYTVFSIKENTFFKMSKAIRIYDRA